MGGSTESEGGHSDNVTETIVNDELALMKVRLLQNKHLEEIDF